LTTFKREFGELIERCWESDSSKRPAIGEVSDFLVQIGFEIIDGVSEASPPQSTTVLVSSRLDLLG
jgi:hypothetical protein